MEKNKEGMQDKFVNMGKWFGSLVEKYYTGDTDEKNEISTKAVTYFASEENYLQLYFSVIPGLMSLEKSRETILTLRELKETVPRKAAIESAKTKAKIIRDAIDAFLSVPEEELDPIVKKLSLYINLFTDMYIKQQ